MGEIPPELGELSNLWDLDLSANRLSGPIPAELGSLSKLKWLGLRGNQLTGPIPAELGKLSRLRSLVLDGNQLSGPIPAELGKLSRLGILVLYDNQLTGPIPAELGHLSNLRRVSLWGNHLEGSIPPELGNLSRLESLVLADNLLTGPIPPELGSLSKLEALGLSGNQLTGPIPPSLLQLEQLRSFYFFFNAGLCAPGTTVYITWLKGIERHGGEYCNEADVAALESLYQATGGAHWTNSDGWLGESGVSDWYGVRADSLGRVTGLDLSGNGLEGRLPGNLYQLSQMIELRIDGNALSGRLPLDLTRLTLQEFHYADTELCAPVEASFPVWLNTIPSHDGTGMECASLTDRDILVALYDATNGPNWIQRENWLTDSPIGDWYGVKVEGNGRVIRLELSNNGLTFPIPLELGSFSNLRHLALFGNHLTGPILPELGNLAQLETLDFGENHLLTGPIPSELGSLSNLSYLALFGNQLTGPIPSELGSLSNLSYLALFGNQLTGPIPPELGSLSDLRHLELGENQLTGPIPPELGSLSNLRHLELGENQLTGPIPPELGSLSNLRHLELGENQLTGPIPPELGNLSGLETLRLYSNQLTGPIPPELGGLERLSTMSLSRNADLSGALPVRLTDLRRLEALLAVDTSLCAPSDANFQNWLEGVWKRRIAPCSRDDLPMAYLTQAVQSRVFPVPLVAGEEALLRVFVTGSGAGGQGIPRVRARFYIDGQERHVVDLPGKPTRIPTRVFEGSLSISTNADVPGEIVQPGLEVVIEIDPDGTLGSGTDLTKRIPETGRQAVEVRAMPTFDLTLIPFLWSSAQDRSILDLVDAMANNPESHELLWLTRTLLPIGDLDVTPHEPVLSSSNNSYALFNETIAIHAMEGTSGRYMGMMSGPVTGAKGIAHTPGKASFSVPDSRIMAHELGHNLSLFHAPCGARDLDPSFPETDGSIGTWGYDFREDGRIVPPSRRDLMSYCSPGWISDYHFTNALRYRLHTAANGRVSSLVAASARSLLLWGGVDAGGTPFLEPAFVVEAAASLPRSTGEYELIGNTADGEELFSLSFEMPQVADGDGRSSFAVVLPGQPEWADQLASITLSGPGGSVTLDQDTNRPVTILRNPRTGQIRAILRDRSAADLASDNAVSALSREPGMEAMTSRGIPDPDDWTR